MCVGSGLGGIFTGRDEGFDGLRIIFPITNYIGLIHATCDLFLLMILKGRIFTALPANRKNECRR